MLFRPSVPWCFPVREVFFESEQHQEQKAVGAAARAAAAVAGKCSQNLHFLPVSEVTLGSFLAPFWCLSVLPCHGAFLSGRCFSSRSSTKSRSSRSSSKSSSRSRKMQPKHLFSTGLRSYVREFLGAILVRFRPSVPWCFTVREVFF